MPHFLLHPILREGGVSGWQYLEILGKIYCVDFVAVVGPFSPGTRRHLELMVQKPTILTITTHLLTEQAFFSEKTPPIGRDFGAMQTFIQFFAFNFAPGNQN